MIFDRIDQILMRTFSISYISGLPLHYNLVIGIQDYRLVVSVFLTDFVEVLEDTDISLLEVLQNR